MFGVNGQYSRKSKTDRRTIHPLICMYENFWKTNIRAAGNTPRALATILNDSKYIISKTFFQFSYYII